MGTIARCASVQLYPRSRARKAIAPSCSEKYVQKCGEQETEKQAADEWDSMSKKTVTYREIKIA
jgi:hypothetical protein